MKHISLIGAGGMASEFITWLEYMKYNIQYLYDNTIEKDIIKNGHVISNKFRKENEHIIAVGYPSTKQKIIDGIKDEIKWAPPIIHPKCFFGNHIMIGMGSIIYPFASFTANINIGGLASINSNVVIGHDCRIGKMFHASPGAIISGNVTIGDRIFMGANSCIIEKLTICDDVIVGAGAVVVKDITEPGKYAGNPARKIGDL